MPAACRFYRAGYGTSGDARDEVRDRAPDAHLMICRCDGRFGALRLRRIVRLRRLDRIRILRRRGGDRATRGIVRDR